MSYPNSVRTAERITQLELELKIERQVCERALEWARHEEAEANRWRNAHASVVVMKRRTSARLGAILERKPAARWRRTKKRVRRSVTKITDKLRRM